MPRTNQRTAPDFITIRRPFRAGALVGSEGRPNSSGRLSGPDYQSWVDHGAEATYTVWSYATPIAWWNRDRGWYTVEQKFSVTTSKHQTVVRRALATPFASV